MDSDEQTHQPRIPEDYPGTARTDRGDAVTGQLEAKPLDNGEHLLRIWTEDRDGPIQLALTPTQVRQWHAQFKICDHRVGIMCPRCGAQGAQNPVLDDWYECSGCVIAFSADGEVETGE